SSDPDGVVAGYAWSFGDGATGSGVTTSHLYSTGGDRTVTLTVTDDDGATGVTTRTVTPVAPPSASFALDTFSRTVVNGLGTAEVGGPWRTTGSTANYSVSNGTGRILLPVPASGPDVSLRAVSATSTDFSLTVSLDKPSTGGGLYVSVGGRRVIGVGEYRAMLRMRANGVIALGVARTAGNVETALVTPAVVQGLTYAPNDQLRVRLQVTGTSPTTIRARVWKAGTAEPTTWNASAIDSTGALQVAGSLGINVYLSSSATNAPVVFSLDDLDARTP
ncbi:MAG TPA: PKD domain-containing protein, partial [Actinotalea sp.]|nr:PKD domain-containing protein [Actinotalea sp.]